MILVSLVLLYLAIRKKFEPLLLIPIGFGGILANIPVAEIAGPEGFLGIIYDMGVANGLFPLLIFMGVGAMTDFGPLMARPKLALLGAAAQFGIFTTLMGALWLGTHVDGIDFTFKMPLLLQSSVAPMVPAIFLSSKLAPDLMGAIAVATLLHGARAHHPTSDYEAFNQ